MTTKQPGDGEMATQATRDDSSTLNDTPAHSSQRRTRRPPTPKAEVERRFADAQAQMTPGQRARLPAVPAKYLLTYKRAVIGDLTARQAVKAFCQQCVGYSGLPDEVAGCVARACPLWSMRPYRQRG